MVGAGRGKVEHAPVYIMMMAQVQDNGDGTWTAQLGRLSPRTFTRDSRAAALLELEQTLGGRK